MARRGRRKAKTQSRKARPLSVKARKWISRKIRFLVKKERRSQKQAAAIAYSMARKRGFRVPKRSKHKHGRKLVRRLDIRAAHRKRRPIIYAELSKTGQPIPKATLMKLAEKPTKAGYGARVALFYRYGIVRGRFAD